MAVPFDVPILFMERKKSTPAATFVKKFGARLGGFGLAASLG
jgi:hypothetical protein